MGCACRSTVARNSRASDAPTRRPSSASRTTSIITLKAHGISDAVPSIRPLLGPDDGDRHREQRHSVLVFPSLRERARRHDARHRSILAARSGGRLAPSARSAASSSPRPKSSPPASSGTSTAASFRSASPRASARERIERLRGAVRRRRARGADPQRHPRRDLAEALGQPVPQSDQRADLRDGGRRHRRRGHARGVPRDDDRGGGDRRASRHPPARRHAKSGSTAPARWARTRCRCCRTWSAAGRWRSSRSSESCRSSGRLTRHSDAGHRHRARALIRQRAQTAQLAQAA